MPSARCPRCAVLVEIQPEAAQNQVINLDSSDGRTTRTVTAKYPLTTTDGGSENRPRYTIARCGSCYGRYIVEQTFGPPKPVWPLPGIEVSEEIPTEVAEAVGDAKKAHAVGAELASLLAARTAVIRVQREQNVSKIQELVSSGKLTEVLYRQADEVRLWANVQGHEDVPPEAIGSEDVDEPLEFLDVVLRTLYVDPARPRKRQEGRKNLGNQAD